MDIENKKEKAVKDYIDELKSNNDYDHEHDRIWAKTLEETWNDLSDFDKDGWSSFVDWQEKQGYTQLETFAFETYDNIVVFFDKIG